MMVVSLMENPRRSVTPLFYN